METPSLRIALADDEAIIRMDLQATIASYGHTITASVGNGKALVESCKSNAPDLIITDITMPVMNGLDAIREIHQNNRVPVIFISGHPFSAEVLSQFPGAICLCKPFDEIDLKDKIAQVCHQGLEFSPDQPTT